LKKSFLTVSPAFFLILVLGYFTGTLFSILGVFACLAVHELFHIAAARQLGLSIQYIAVMPFGIGIRFNSEKIRSNSAGFFLCGAGPAGNLAFAAALYALQNFIPREIYNFLMTANLSLAIFNLLPVISLDGGRMLFIALSRFTGSIVAYNVTVKISKILTAMLMLCGIAVMIVSKFNLGLLTVSSFLMYSIWDGSGYERLTMMRDALDYKQKKNKSGVYKAHSVILEQNKPCRKVFKHFTKYNVCIINIVDDNMRIVKTLTEKEAVDLILAHGADYRYKS